MTSRRSYSRDRSRSPEPIYLPHNAKSISETDYFYKHDEFRMWLKEEKGKYFDELTSEKSRSYFRKFVKAWNNGKLHKSMYASIDIESLPSTTSYKWSFASKASKEDETAIRNARNEVTAASYAPRSSGEPSRGRVLGPTLPSTSDLALAREDAEEEARKDRGHKRKRERAEAKDRIEDMVGPREVGKAGMLEKKKAKRDADKSFRERGDEGLEVDESTLMGGGDGFKEQLARRDAVKNRYDAAREEKDAIRRERASARQEKETATMAMFQQLAKQRFG